MKKLRITVNDTVYDVTVQVLEDDEQVVAPPAPYPGAAGALAAARSAARPAAAPAPAPAATNGSALPSPDANTVRSPIAGTVQKLFAAPGGSVEAKAPLVLLDAMKMDTYIYAPRSGRIAEVAVAPTDSVQVGDVLVRYVPES